MNPLVIYHKGCADGFGAAWVFYTYDKQQMGRMKYEFHPGVYSETPPDVTDRDVYLVDFSYKRVVVEEMLTKAKSITLIDHHKTALEDLEPLYDHGRIEAFISLDHSGAMLAWDYLYDGAEAPTLLRHIEDRDLWKFKLPYTREIMAAVYSYDQTFEVWDKLFNRKLQELITEGEALLRKQERDIKSILEVSVRRMNIYGYNVPAVNIPHMFASDAGNILAEGEHFAACYYDTEHGRIFSLRSRGSMGVDVSAIAKFYGGGGHEKAAGFKVSYSRAALFEMRDMEG